MAERFDAEADCLKVGKAAWGHNPADNDDADSPSPATAARMVA
jgi:hypothetical protein